MGIFFQAGEKKVRPGVYQRYENIGTAPSAGAVNGICAAVFRGNWGPLDTVMTFDSADAMRKALGNGGANSTMQALTELFNGGAITLKVVRLGSGGATKATATLLDTAETPETAIDLTTKYEGSRPLAYGIRTVLGDNQNKEFIVVEGTTILEKLLFVVGENEAKNLVEIIADKSNYVTALIHDGYTGKTPLALVAETSFTGGTDPVVTNEDYSNAFVKLEAHRWNTISVDTDETAVHNLLGAYMNRVYNEGKMAFAIVGEPTSVSLETRMSHAKAFNDYNIIYVGGGVRLSTGEVLEGYMAVARVAGMVASVPSSESLTHRSITNAIEPLELLTNSQYEEATKSGMLTFSVSSQGITWIENAITSLVVPAGQDDEGWKKIKRAKVRYELMSRISDTIEPLIGVVINNSDGQANIIKIAKGICLDMVNETKLLPNPSPEVYLDSETPPEGDSAWFIVRADDADAIEKAYFTFKFRYSPSLV